MKMDVIPVGTTQKKLQVVVPASDVKKELDKAYRQLGRRARLPGFRPGKAPRRVLEMKFGPQVADDVAQNLIQQGYMMRTARGRVATANAYRHFGLTPPASDSSMPLFDQD